MSELNKNLEKKEVRYEVSRMLKETIPGAKYCAGGNESYVTEETRRQGGVAIITKQIVNRYVTERRTDDKGRWAVTEIKVGEVRLVIYNIYVPLQEDGGGPTTVRRQLQNSLDEEGIIEDQRVHFYKDLREQVDSDIKKGKSVIVGGEFNETHEEGGIMYKTMMNLGLVNYFKERMGKVPPTRRPGKRTIDHVWMTP